MRSKFFYIILSSVLLTVGSIRAQANLLNAKTVDQISDKPSKELGDTKPVPYGYINDRDILWSKIVWEYVDLNQKINLPYYYPVDTTGVASIRRSLFDVLINGIKTGKIKNVYSDSFFSSKMSKEDLKSKLVNERKNGDYTDTYTIQSEDVTAFMLKGIWYFDKRQGELKYRLLGIAPMGRDVQTLGAEGVDDKDNLYELFWVFYPSARQVLFDAKVFNSKNSLGYVISYDGLLNARRFNSVIVKEQNMYGNRAIIDYTKGNSLFQLLESNRIKEEIRNKELDMWNY